MRRKVIYFLCTGNSARSQMAEGFAKEYLNVDEWEVHGAGMDPHGLNPHATEVMKEIGIDVSNQQSNLIDTNLMNNAHSVITLCDDARARCPQTPDEVNSLHWSLEDPAAAEGTKEQKLEVFRRVRDQIDRRVKEFIEMQKRLANKKTN